MDPSTFSCGTLFDLLSQDGERFGVPHPTDAV